MNINKLILTSIVGITAVTGAFAEEAANKPNSNEALDYQTVTSRKYVDVKLGEKQNNIAVTNAPFVYDEDYNPAADGSLVETTDKVGVVGQRGIFNGKPEDYRQNVHEEWVPTMGAMMTQLTAVAGQIPTLPTGTNGNVPVYDANGNLGTVQRPILSWNASGTVNDATALGGYSTTFGDAAGNWPAAHEDALVDGEALAESMALKQNKIPGGTAGNILTYSGTDGQLGTPLLVTKKATASLPDNDTSVPTSGMVKKAVDAKQNKIEATDTAFSATAHPTYAGGSLVATTGTDGTVGERGIATARHNAADPTTGQVSLQNGDWVPTVDMLITEVNAVAGQIPTLPTGTNGNVPVYDASGNLGTVQRPVLSWNASGTVNDATALGGYSTTFGDAAGNWPAAHEDALVDGEALAESMALKQNKLSGTSGHVVTYTANAGVVSGTPVVTSLTNNNTDIPTTKAVGDKIQRMGWTQYDMAAVQAYSRSFDGSAGAWSSAQEDKLVNGSVLANALALKQNKKTCAEWAVQNPSTGVYTSYTDAATAKAEAATLGTSANCWLWTFDGDEPVAQASQSSNG